MVHWGMTTPAFTATVQLDGDDYPYIRVTRLPLGRFVSFAHAAGAREHEFILRSDVLVGLWLLRQGQKVEVVHRGRRGTALMPDQLGEEFTALNVLLG